MGGADEEGLNELLGTLEWDSPAVGCEEMLGLIGERVLEENEEAQSSNDKVFIYKPESEHVGTKRKGRYTRGTSKTVGLKWGAKKKTKVVRHTTLIFYVPKC